MANLFGVDLQKIVADALKGQLRPGTLMKTTPGARTAGSLTGGTNPTTASHTFEGFVEKKSMRRSGQIGAELMPIVTIIGGSVSPAAVPEINDTVTIDGTSYQLLELMSRDPAEAVYEFRTEE